MPNKGQLSDQCQFVRNTLFAKASDDAQRLAAVEQVLAQ